MASTRSAIPTRREGVRGLFRRPWRGAAVLLIAALFLTNIYRAATQSISHDEGVIFEWLLSGSWSQVLGVEHWNHHVLSDLLCKFTLNLFGPSEIAYRIPALLGGLLYFYSVFQISALLFPEGYLLLWSVAFLSMNPLVLDYLCCARGYGPGLGLFMYALYQVARFLAGRSLRDLNRAGVALGLSIGSNIIMMFPGGALAASLVGILAADALVRPPEPVAVGGKKVGRRKARKAVSVTRAGWAQALLHFVVPAVAIGGFISALPQRLIELVAGYTGPPSLRSILEGLVRYSLLHSPWSFAGLLAWFPPNALISIITVFFVPAGLAGLTLLGIRIAATRCGLDALPEVDRFLLLLAAMLPVTILLIVASRYLFDQPYPELRTAVYWIPLLTLAGLCWIRRLTGPFAIAAAAVIGLCILQYCTQFNTRYFAEWQYCAAGKDMMRIVRDEHAAHPGTRVRLGVTWQLEPVVNFYRVAWRLDWMDPVYRESPNGSFDYYALAYDDVALVDPLHLKALLRDRLSGTALARRADF